MGPLQVSAWADFATFQLPRFIGGVALTSADVVSLDVAIRAGQAVVAPLFAFYPTVLPRAAALLARGGADALRLFLQRFYSVGVLLVVAAICILVPVEVPALAVWTGRSTSAFNPIIVVMVLVGTVAHASTGLLTSAMLARGDVNPVLVYKGRQLLLALVLIGAAAPIGLLSVAIAMCLSLLLPAVAFNVRSARELGLELVSNGAGNFSFHSEDVVEFPIITFRPEMFVVRSANQLHIHVHGVGDFLYAALQQIRHAQLPADVAQIVRRAFVFLGRSPRDDLERCDLRQTGQDFVLDAVGKIGVIGIAAEVLKRQNSDTFFGNRRSQCWHGLNASGRGSECRATREKQRRSADNDQRTDPKSNR